jgi:hypothetical protein
MQTKSGFLHHLRPLVLCLLVIFVIACGSREKFIGAYKAAANDSSKQTETLMELKANGDGVWRVNEEEVPFAWYVKDGELRINTKGGGVIVGTIEKNAFRVTIPGIGTLLFEKVQ